MKTSGYIEPNYSGSGEQKGVVCERVTALANWDGPIPKSLTGRFSSGGGERTLRKKIGMKKRLLSFVLTLCMMVSLLPVTAIVADIGSGFARY